MMKNQKRAVCLLACLLIAGFTAAQEKKESAQTASGSKEEGNRNVMLNASSANGPREISIGLPGGDVNVLENGLPVVYTSNPHNVIRTGVETAVSGTSGCSKSPKPPLLPAISVML